MLPSIKGLKFSKLNYDSTCAYLEEKNGHTAETKKYILDVLASYCRKNKPYKDNYKQQIKSYNNTVHHILKNEIDFILPQLPTKNEVLSLHWF